MSPLDLCRKCFNSFLVSIHLRWGIMATKTVSKKVKEEGVLAGVDYDHPVLDYRAERIASILKKLSAAKSSEEVKEIFKKDIFSGFYLPIPMVKEPEFKSKEAFEYYQLMLQSLSSQGFKELRDTSVAKSRPSVVAAASFISSLMENLDKMASGDPDPQKRQLAKELKEMLTGNQEQQQGQQGQQGKQGGQQSQQNGQQGSQAQGQQGGQQQQQGGGQQQSQGGQQSQQNGSGSQNGNVNQQGPGNGLSEEQIKQIIKDLLEGAISNAKESVENMQQIEKFYQELAGVGHDLSFDSDFEKIMEMAKNTDIKKILELLNGLPELSKIVKRRYRPYSRGENSGFDIGDDLERLSIGELAMPELLFDLKFSEGHLTLYRRGIKESRSSLFVLIDKSGSMGGSESDKILWAKATAVALLMVARKESRNFHYLFFDDNPFDVVDILRSTRRREVAKAATNLAAVAGTGGTNITRAIEESCSKLLTEKKYKELNEIILITDGGDSVDVAHIKSILALANAELITIVVKGSNDALRLASRHYLVLQEFGRDQLLKVLELAEKDHAK